MQNNNREFKPISSTPGSGGAEQKLKFTGLNFRSVTFYRKEKLIVPFCHHFSVISTITVNIQIKGSEATLHYY